MSYSIFINTMLIIVYIFELYVARYQENNATY